MERCDRAALATFYAEGTLAVGVSVALGESAAQHARVRRIAVGEAVRLTNGTGTLATGQVTRLAKADLSIDVRETYDIAAPATLRLFVPVADRERMLWLAEKCAELGVTAWQPVVFQRSLSVAPRGEGDAFHRKVRARMIAALEQSGGAWMPAVRGERRLEELIENDASEPSIRYLLDPRGTPLIAVWPAKQLAVDVMVGPEGGIEASELNSLLGRAWLPVSLSPRTLRFETAGVLAVGMLRALMRDG